MISRPPRRLVVKLLLVAAVNYREREVRGRRPLHRLQPRALEPGQVMVTVDAESRMMLPRHIRNSGPGQPVPRPPPIISMTASELRLAIYLLAYLYIPSESASSINKVLDETHPVRSNYQPMIILVRSLFMLHLVSIFNSY